MNTLSCKLILKTIQDKLEEMFKCYDYEDIEYSDGDLMDVQIKVCQMIGYFNLLESKWNDFELEYDFSITEFDWKKETKIFKVFNITNMEFMSTFIEDNVTKLKIIVSSNYNDSFSSEANVWIERFFRLKMLFQSLNMFRSKFTKVLRIVLSKVISLDEYMDEFYSICDDYEKVCSICKLSLVDDEIISLVELMIQRVDFIEIRINKYLDDIRYECPRLYFVQDSDVIEIIGNCDLELYLFKIFPGISSLIKDEDMISGIISYEGERIMFENVIKYKKEENVKFINELDMSIKRCLKGSFLLSLDDLSSFYSNDKFYEEIFIRWIGEYPIQVLILSISILWTELVENCKTVGDIEELGRFMSKVIDILVSNLKHYEGIIGLKIYQLFLTINYQLNKIVEVGIVSKSSLKWLRCVRYYYCDGVIQIKIMSKVYSYGFEYVSNVQKMIITRITEHFYSFASLALDCSLLPSAQGPAGTGKTETIKSLSYITGSNMMVFNFSELYEVEDIEKILSGLCILGYWGIFDEFNRLTECVLSSVTEKIEKICNKGNDKVILLEREIKINYNTACFITINPGYSGRNELPLNCVHLCQQFVMEDIDLFSIIDVNLKINGFKDTILLSHEIVFILDSLQLVFTSIKYDFGLRFVKCVFKFIGHLEVEYYGRDDKSLFIESLHRLLFPRLTIDEVKIYEYIVPFSNKITYSSEEINFIEMLRKLSNDEYLISKSFQIYEMTIVSSSVILYGELNSGKSSSFNLFLDCVRLIRVVDLVVFDANSIETTQLYGYKVDDKWVEGLIPYLLKTNGNEERYIVFDGDMKQEWVENLNSLLDDNRILTLSNGERVPLKDNIKIFFETDSFEGITPATISRSTVIQFEIRDEDYGSEVVEVDDIVSRINGTDSLMVECQEGFGLVSYVKEVFGECNISTIYLSEGLESMDFIDYLMSLCELNDNGDVIGSKINSKIFILIRDFYVLKNKNKCSSLYAILRQMIQYKYFYKYSNKKIGWEKIFLERIVFIFVKTEEMEFKCRLLSKLKMVKLGEGIDNSDSCELNKEEFQILNDEVVCKCETDRFYLKCDSIEDNYRFIYLSLLRNERFVCLYGSSVSGKRFLCQLVSSNLGFEMVELSDKSQGEIFEYVLQCGLGNKRYSFFINVDLLMSISPNIYYIIKNIICKEYFMLFGGDRIRDIFQKYIINKTYDQFTVEFYDNLNDNMRFILTGSIIEESMLKRMTVYRMKSISYKELVSMSGDIFSDVGGNKIIADIYLKCKEFIGNRFIDFIFIVKIAKRCYSEFTKSNFKTLKHLSKGVEKIELFKNEVNLLESSLNVTKEKLKVMNTESEKKIKILEDKQFECEEKRKVAIVLMEKLKERKIKSEVKKDKIKKEIENVSPMIEKAKEEVENINKKSLEELKSMYNPPFVVKYTIETVSMVLRNGKRLQWDEARKMLKTQDFISKIVSYDVENMSEQAYNLLKERVSIPQWDSKRISKASKAAGPLAKWSDSIKACYEIYNQIIPLKKEVQEIEEENYKNEEILINQNILIADLENEIERNREDYCRNIDESTKILNEIEITESKLKVSKKIIGDLTEEMIRWNEKICEIEKDRDCLIANSIIEAIIPIYTSLDYNRRNNFMDECIKIIEDRSYKYSFDVQKVFNIEKHVIERNFRFRHIIILDSNESEYMSLIEEPVSIVSACEDSFIKIMEAVKSLSGRLVIKDIHCCSTLVKNYILNEFKNKLEKENDFTIYIISTNEYFKNNYDNDRYILESILNRSLVLNMKLNREYFVQFARKKVVEILEPEIHSLYVNSNNEICKLNFEISKNESMLVDKLIDSDIFDPDFIKFIDSYKNETSKLEFQLETLKGSGEKYSDSLESKGELIELICEIYGCLESLSGLNSLYCFDFNIVFHFSKVLYGNDDYLCDIVTATYNLVVNGIFHHDKLYWGITMLKLLSKYISELKVSIEFIENENSIESRYEINHLISKYLKSDKFNGIIENYYDTIILMTDGFQDPLYVAKSLSDKMGKNLDIYAVGSPSEMKKVYNSLVNSLKLGNYLVLKNIHLSKTWINKIETEFVNKQKGTKIFLTCDKKVEMSKNMLMSCHKIICELSSFKSLINHLFETYKSMVSLGSIFGFILLKCIFVYSIIFIRQLYIPFGWTKNYNFNINDLKMTLNTSKEVFQVENEKSYNQTLEELNEIFIEIYSVKISNFIDLKILEDIIKISNEKIEISDYFNIDEWISNIDDDMKVLGFTKYTQNEIFRVKSSENERKQEYITRDIDIDYKISWECNIFENFMREEIEEFRFRGVSNINPDDHKKTCESVSRFIKGDKNIFINLNNFILTERLLNLLKFPISKRNNCESSEIDLRVGIGDFLIRESEENGFKSCDSFRTKAILYNGTYLVESNSIAAGIEGEESHTLNFCWTPRVKNQNENGFLVTCIPLYSSNGFVPEIISNV